jgi:hypothetical protein
MPDPNRPDDPKTIGDAESLFDTDELRPIKVPPPAPTTPSAPPSHPSVSDGYELEGVSFPEVDEPPRPVPIPTPVERPKARSVPKPKEVVLGTEDSGSTEFATEVSDVDPVWTRAAEWSPDLVRVGAAGLGTLFLAWLFSGSFFFFSLMLVLGGAATVLLSYPILITLERPVRITPEQAVNDFYAAASHHFPNYRRMWLLLSTMGRDSGRFGGFEGFRDHWKGRIERWRQSKGAGKYAPLKFEVDGFRADKSTGKETSKADYTVNIFLRDREGEGPIESIKMVHGLVKGPDRMWYLNRGTLDPRSK